ncbi:M28 family peptidase [Olsenella massiliensis]|uniref:M28 family peptidase n=1 Tax=Olsenella massiliensis TaxID=1622075 RepID=UPI00071D3AD6|nr:M28 family peptidase [Olsenella massiliensis]
MASTRDYTDYLNDRVDIAPANSQEELDAAQLIHAIMDEHGLDATIQEFDAPAQGDLAHDLTYLLLVVGMVMSGILGTPAGVIGRLLVLLCTGVLAARFGGYDLLGGLGPKARSQNVIGVHRAEGPLVVKGNRPIVVVAHYDTPNEGLLHKPQTAGFLPVIRRSSLWIVAGIALCAFVQLLGFIPDAARHLFWIVGMLAGVPLLAVAAAGVYERFAPCTAGANDNKSSVAALLGVLDLVRPADDAAKRWAASHPRTAPAKQDGTAPAPATHDGEDAAPAAPDGPYGRDADEDAAGGVAAVSARLGGLAASLRTGALDLVGRARGAVLHDEGAPDGRDVQDDASDAPTVVATTRTATPASSEWGSVELAQPTLRLDGEAPHADENDAESPQEGAPEDLIEQAHDVQAADDDLRPGREQAASAAAPAPATSSQARMRTANEKPLDATGRAGAVSYTHLEVYKSQAPETVATEEAFHGVVRRGAGFVESLQILPSDCEIVYERPPRPKIDLSRLPEVPAMPEFRVEDFYLPPTEGQQEGPEVDDETGTGYIPPFINPHRRSVTSSVTADVAASADDQATARYAPHVDDAYRADDGSCAGASYPPTTQDLLDRVPIPEYQVVGVDDAGHDGQAPARRGETLDDFNATEGVEATAEPSSDVPNDNDAPASASDGDVRSEDSYDDERPYDAYYDDDLDDYDVEPAGILDKIRFALADIGGRLSKRDKMSGNTETFMPLPDTSRTAEVARPAPAAATDEAHPTQTGGVEPAGRAAADSTLPQEQGDADSTAQAEPPTKESGATVTPDSSEEDASPSSLVKGNFDTGDDTRSLVEGDMAGLDLAEEEPQPEERPAPRPIDDPQWGTPDYAPASPVAQRAALFDLPDPSVMPKDPFAPDDLAPVDIQDAQSPSDDGAAQARGQRQPIGLVRPQHTEPAAAPASSKRPRSERFGSFGRLGRKRREEKEQPDSMSEWLGVDEDYDAKKNGRAIGSWDKFKDEEGGNGRRRPWKGGATERFDLRDEEAPQAGEASPDVNSPDAGERPSEEDLRESILGMSDDELLSHDIWFVALGASTLRHAGMREFLADYRKSIRGAFVINLDSVGAGDLTLLTKEGVSSAHRADRRLAKLLAAVAKDLHIPLGRMRFDWTDTDATPAMEASLRAATIMGVSSQGVPALSRTADDVAENVNDRQVGQVTELVAELIRRS